MTSSERKKYIEENKRLIAKGSAIRKPANKHPGLRPMKKEAKSASSSRKTDTSKTFSER